MSWMSELDQLRSWLEDTGHSGCAGDLITAIRDHPETAAGVARDIAEHVEDDTRPCDRDEAACLPGELRAWADELERRLAPAPLGGTFPAGSAQVIIREGRAGDPETAAWLDRIRELRTGGYTLPGAITIAGHMPGRDEQEGH
jgi:hypothetical protein